MSDWNGIAEMVAVSDAGSFAGAARALGVSTSHVSRAIALLESRLQAPLFYRTTRQVRLTDLGAGLVEQFRSIIRNRDEALAWAAGDGEPHGEIRLSCPVALGERYVAPIVRRYTAQYPLVSITMDLTNRVIDPIAEGYDLVIRTGKLSDSRLAGIKLASRALILCACPEYIRRRGGPASVADLDRYECLVGSAQLWQFQYQGSSLSHRPNGRWRCNSGAAVLDAALGGMGICQLPAFYIIGHLGSRLVELLPEYRAPEEPIWAAYPKRLHVAPKIRNLIESIAVNLSTALNLV
jgi:DNA-binding transcriptional LysR family regulator